MRSLDSLGWNSFFDEQYLRSKRGKCFPARIVSQHSDVYHMISEHGEHLAKVTGRFRYLAGQMKDYPVVGDFVLAEKTDSANALIHMVLQRKNFFARKMPISGGRKMKNGVIDGGITEEQIVASNVDTAFIVCGLDRDFSISRIERYLTLAHHQKIQTVILLNKSDLCKELDVYFEQVRQIVVDSPVFPVSAAKRTGLDPIHEYMTEGKTIVFLGSSGVGKSTLLNSLMEHEMQNTRETSVYSGKGTHTTTHRQMFFHLCGGMIIDTPGMRELQLWAERNDLGAIYEDVVRIMSQCEFTNCTHQNETGCAVRGALKSGTLSEERLARYLTQLRELTRLDERKREYSRKRGRKKRF